MQPLKLQVTKI